MTGCGAVRKPLCTRESTLAALRATIADFSRENIAWEREFESLLDDVESLASGVAIQGAYAMGNSGGLGQQLNEVSTHQMALSQKQQDTAVELALLRELVEQQSELLIAIASPQK